MKNLEFRDILYLFALGTIISLQLYFHYKNPERTREAVHAAPQDSLIISQQK